MSNPYNNGSFDSKPGSKVQPPQDKIQTRQTTLDFMNKSARRQTFTPNTNNNLSILQSLRGPYEENSNSGNELNNDFKIKKKTPSSNINGRKGSINNGNNGGKEGGISANKRKEDYGDGLEVEITEIKSKKIKLEVKEEEEGNFLGKESEFFLRGLRFFSNNLTSIFCFENFFKILFCVIYISLLKYLINIDY